MKIVPMQHIGAESVPAVYNQLFRQHPATAPQQLHVLTGILIICMHWRMLCA